MKLFSTTTLVLVLSSAFMQSALLSNTWAANALVENHDTGKHKPANADSASTAPADSIRIPTQQQSALGIRMGVAQAVQSMDSLTLPGEVTLPVGKEIIISAPQSGVIDKLHVVSGQMVSKGQLLAHLSSQELVGLQRDFLQAQTRQRLAKQNLERDAELFKEGIIAERRYLTTQAEYDDARTTFEQGKHSLRIAGLDEPALNRMQSAGNLTSGTTLIAPISGQVIEHNVNPGQRVEPATPLFRIADLSTLWVLIHVPVDSLSKVHVGSSVKVSKAEIPGKVISIVRNVNRSDQTVQVRAAFKDEQNLLAKNQYVEVKLVLDQASANSSGQFKSAQFKLPRAAIARHGGKAYVFSRLDSERFAPTEVHILGESADQITVTTRGQLGKEVAIAGIATLKAAWLAKAESQP